MTTDAKRNGGLVWVSDHIQDDRWPERAGRDAPTDRYLKRIWWNAEPIDYPSARGASTIARYHPPTNLVLLAENGNLTTCIPLSNRPLDEQRYVRQQVSTQ